MNSSQKYRVIIPLLLLSLAILPTIAPVEAAKQISVTVSPTSRTTTPGGTVQFTLSIYVNYPDADYIYVYALVHEEALASWYTVPDMLFVNHVGTYTMTLYMTVSSSEDPGTYLNYLYITSFYYPPTARSNNFYVVVT